MHRRPARTAALILISLPLLIGCNTRSRGGDDDDDDGGGGPSTSLAAGLTIDAISINQGVEILLMDGGSEVSGSRNAPVIAGRGGVIRIYVDRDGDFESREITAAVKFIEGDDTVATYEVTQTVSTDSTATSLSSTLNVEFDAEEMTGSTEITVSLHEADDEDHDGSTSGASWDEAIDLNARDTDGPLHIALVPIQYNADGSGRLPDLSDGQIQRYEERFERLYPTSDIFLDVREAVAWSAVISPFGQGWSELLDGLIGYRASGGFGDEV